MTIGNVFEHLPTILPNGQIRVQEDHEFTQIEYDDGGTATQYVYQLDKAPVESVKRVTGVVNDHPATFDQDTDYVVVDDTGDGEPDSIEFQSGETLPDPGTEFTVTYVCESILSRYINEHENDVTVSDIKIDEAIDSRQIDNASRTELDHIGAIFGDLGKRRGRSDDEYRALLRSIVQSFTGRGTISGLRFAIAAGIGSNDPTSDVIIEEDFQDVGYTIRIENTDASFIGGVINDMADLADPSGVELLQPPIIVSEPTFIDVEKDESQVVESTVGLGGGTLTLDGNSTLG